MEQKTNRSRLALQSLLEELLGSKNVYYQPPENLKMVYPFSKFRKITLNNFPCTTSEFIFFTSNLLSEILI